MTMRAGGSIVPPFRGAFAIGIRSVERDAPCLATEQFLYLEGHKPDFSNQCKNMQRKGGIRPTAVDDQS
jgi:hypothetical protein